MKKIWTWKFFGPLGLIAIIVGSWMLYEPITPKSPMQMAMEKIEMEKKSLDKQMVKLNVEIKQLDRTSERVPIEQRKLMKRIEQTKIPKALTLKNQKIREARALEIRDRSAKLKGTAGSQPQSANQVPPSVLQNLERETGIKPSEIEALMNK